MAKVITEKNLYGQDTLVVITTPIGNQGLYVRALVDEGKPYWWWPTIPAGKVIGCDFTNAPIVTDDPVENNARINAITAQPEDVLTYE